MREENVHACFEILSIMQDKGLKLLWEKAF